MKIEPEELKVSASALKTYESCPRKYYFSYIKKLPKKKWPHTELGNFVHNVLEDFHNQMRDNPLGPDEWPALFKQLCIKHLEEYPLTPEQRATARNMLFAYLEKLKDSGLPNVLHNEKGFSVKLPDNVLIRGFIDRIDLEGELLHIIDYKGLALDTPIPTPTGWTTMGELQVGDQVFGSDGKACNVTVKSRVYNRPCYKITFSDHSEVVCDNVHLWPVSFIGTNIRDKRMKILNADEIFAKFNEFNESKAGSIIIKNHKPLQYPTQELPIDPWVLGAWLGDGHRKTGSLTVGEQDFTDMTRLIEEKWGNFSVTQEQRVVEGRGKIFTVTLNQPLSGHCRYGHDQSIHATMYGAKGPYCKLCQNRSSRRRNGTLNHRDSARNNLSLRGLLQINNLRMNKHIPQIYLTSSFEQRLELLRGLMDTDGSFNDQRGRCVFVSADRKFALSVRQLIRTFGLTTQMNKCVDKLGFTSYRIEFTPYNLIPFNLKRKAEQVQRHVFKQPHRYRSILNIEKVDSVPTQCISVDSSDSLYVCGEGFNTSHNTGKSKFLDEFQLVIYALALMAEDPSITRVKGSYLALAEGCKTIPYSISKTDVDRCRDEIVKISNQIRSDKTWETRPTRLCNYCDFKAVCPAMVAEPPEWGSIVEGE